MDATHSNEQGTVTTVASIRLPKALHAELKALAKEGDRSLNAQIVRLLREHPAIAARLAGGEREGERGQG